MAACPHSSPRSVIKGEFAHIAKNLEFPNRHGKAFDFDICVPIRLQTPGGRREALWPSRQCVAVGGELNERFQAARVFICIVGDVAEILDSSFSVGSLQVSLSVIWLRTRYSFLALG